MNGVDATSSIVVCVFFFCSVNWEFIGCRCVCFYCHEMWKRCDLVGFVVVVRLPLPKVAASYQCWLITVPISSAVSISFFCHFDCINFVTVHFNSQNALKKSNVKVRMSLSYVLFFCLFHPIFRV